MLKIYFDENLVDGKYIRLLTQQATSFETQFKLGSTICRAFELEIDKKANLTSLSPNKVYIKEGTNENNDNDVLYATLYVDNLDESNDTYYIFSLVDVMIKLNQEFTYDITASQTVLSLVRTICANHNISLVTQSFYMDDLVVSWNQEDMTERDFVSYVAEVNGGYAYIDANGNLVVQTYSQTSSKTISVEECSSFKVGTQHLIDRVYVELASATHYYPDTTENETVYLNSDNILLTDSGSYTIENIIQHIQETITGLNFYNIKVNRCPIDTDVLCGNLITFNLNDNSYNTIAQIGLTYNNGWFGGYELELDSASQQETTLPSNYQLVKNIKVKVDRELNSVTQRVESAEKQIEVIDANAIKSVDVYYVLSSSETEVIKKEGTDWSTIAPQWTKGYYMWQKTVTTYMDETSVESNPTCISGAMGQDGAGISKITSLYYCSENNDIPQKPTSHVIQDSDVYNEWTTYIPTYTETYKYYFTCSEMLSTNGTYNWSDVTVNSTIEKIGKNEKNIASITSNVSSIEQSENSIEMSVKQITDTVIPDLDARTQILETCVSIQTEGVRISQGTLGAYTLLTESGMEIYAEGTKVAYALNDGFYATDYIMDGWHMTTANNKNSFCFVRKEYE